MNPSEKAIEELKGDIKSILIEIKYIKSSTDTITEQLASYEKRLRDVENKQGQLDTKLSVISILQTGLSIVIGAIAAFFGSKQG